jgi:hypothetical protein
VEGEEVGDQLAGQVPSLITMQEAQGLLLEEPQDGVIIELLEALSLVVAFDSFLVSLGFFFLKHRCVFFVFDVLFVVVLIV